MNLKEISIERRASLVSYKSPDRPMFIRVRPMLPQNMITPDITNRKDPNNVGFFLMNPGIA